MLGRKQSVRNNEDWKNALDHIEETVPKKELDSLVKKTVKDIKEKCKGKKAAYAWSAGKDSLVLGEICEKAGIDQSVLVRCNLEYPAFIAWVDRNKIKPNDYNPNKVSRQNLELLTQSIFTNGWTLPIVVRPDGTIIDGFHRWTVAGPDWKYVPPSEEDDRRTLYERLEGKVLVVIVDHKDKAKNIYGTVTHNRARGTHLLEPMKKIVKELMDEGKTVEEIGKQLGMRPEEIFRLSDFSKEDFLKMMTKGVTGYSKAEFITKI